MYIIWEKIELKRAIDEKIDELEEVKYQIIDRIKEKIFPKYDSQKQFFLVQIKGKKVEKIAHKKDLQKQVLKEELRAELLEEIKK